MKPLIVALDLETDREAMDLVRQLAPYVDVFKVGPVLFLKYGPPLIQSLTALGAKIFLDLKFHDIPSVVQKAVERAGDMGVYSATLHTGGGPEMMRAAAEAKRKPKLWGVTVLTSFDAPQLDAIGVQRPIPDQVSALASLAVAAGLDGVVASVREVTLIRKVAPASFSVVTPGIRFQSGSDDQKRAETPAEAMKQGTNFFVMGRPILEATDRVRFVQTIYESIQIRTT